MRFLYVCHVCASNWNNPAYAPLTALGLNPDSHSAVWRILFGSTPNFAENRSINSLICWEVALGVGVGVAVGIGVGVDVGSGVGVGVGVGVAVGIAVGVGVGFIICHPKTFPFVLTPDSINSIPANTTNTITKYFRILTVVV